jgi:redox-sensitive bicupin YhaK (pirin superfamily)|tara:strand:+ start:7109 stop:7963 length:855 start_codon:yes stop_codon:yes gene_type:complete
MNPKNIRKVVNIINGIPTTDGAGVELVRVIGQSALMELDPFLLLDAFRSDNPDDYIGGFPAHPHRGFETVTYLLNGRMRHKDNTGNEGIIAAGSVQWMTAGKGIIHSEMPEQENGLLEGFQLWINLPKSHKMTSPQYQEYDNDSIPTEDRNNASIKVISGKTSHGTQGPVEQPLTAPLYFDIQLEANTTLTETLPHEHNAFVYVIKGEVTLLDEKNEIVSIKRDQLAILTKGESLTLTANDQSTQFLLIAGKPLNEPIARGGPFIMNTQDEIQQAFSDYQNGQL